MSLVGYRNLAWLKARLLPADMGEESDYDADIEAIGKGVAAHFDRFTGRILRRATGVIYECAADREAVVLSCYPVEALTAVQLVDGATVSDISSAVIGTLPKAGIVRFSGLAGANYQTLRLTVTGGYFCENGAAALPAGATPLPDDLLQAWVQQCRAVCQAENIFRTKGAEKPNKGASAIETLTLLPGVRAVLQLHLRLP